MAAIVAALAGEVAVDGERDRNARVYREVNRCGLGRAGGELSEERPDGESKSPGQSLSTR